MAIMTLAEVKTYPAYTSDMSDAHITLLLPGLRDRLRRVTNNKFIRKAVQIVSSGISFAETSGIITVDINPITEGFADEENILVEDSVKNDGYFTIDGISTTTLEVEEDLVDEDLDEEVTITFVKWPEAINNTLVGMLRYDILEREKKKGLASESIGDYSVSWLAGITDYPSDLIGELINYTRPRML